MNKEYFKQNEDNCYEKLLMLQDKLPIDNIGRTPEKYHYDASGTTTLSGKTYEFAIELKDRFNYSLESFNKFGSIMIEAHKLSQLLLELIINNRIPFYINFTSDGYAIIYNVRKLKKYPTLRKFNNIQSKGYERRESGDRFMLDLHDAMIIKL